MNHSFKFIVRPNRYVEIEITSLLQYCALKNILSNFDLNNIKSLKYNENHVLFSETIINADPRASFTEYILMTQSERDAFKQKTFKEEGVSLFFDAISEVEYKNSFTDLRPTDYDFYGDPFKYTVEDLYLIFMNHEHAKKYLSKYIPKNSKEIRYVDMDKNTWEDYIIRYYDNSIKFDIIDSWHKDKEVLKEYAKLINCIKRNTYFHYFKNNGHIENTYDEFCVYTEDPAIIHKVLMNNQAIIDKMANDISYINHRQHDNYSHRSIVFNEFAP